MNGVRVRIPSLELLYYGPLRRTAPSTAAPDQAALHRVRPSHAQRCSSSTVSSPLHLQHDITPQPPNLSTTAPRALRMPSLYGPSPPHNNSTQTFLNTCRPRLSPQKSGALTSHRARSAGNLEIEVRPPERNARDALSMPVLVPFCGFLVTRLALMPGGSSSPEARLDA